MAYARLHPNAIGSVITYLEMVDPPSTPPCASDTLRLVRLETPTLQAYLDLFRTVGQHWLWIERLITADPELEAMLGNPAVEIYSIADGSGEDLGMLELHFEQSCACKIAYIGLVPKMIGKGHGRWLLDQALALAWREGVNRVHLNTCTLDHPRALRAYLAAGFNPYERAIGTFVDPRLRGLLPRDAAPHIPIIGGLSTGDEAGNLGGQSSGSGRGRVAGKNQDQRKKA